MSAAPHCEYCGCTAVECLARCPETGLYFCNGKGMTSQSHIVHYLRSRQLDKFTLPDGNPFKDIPLECYVCQSENVYRLGLATGTDGSHYIVCRSPCYFSEMMQSKGVADSDFIPIIGNNEIFSEFVGVPTAEQYTQVPICKALDVVNQVTAATGQDKSEPIALQRAKLRYDSVAEYQEVMGSFVEAERRESELQGQRYRFNGLEFSWKNDRTVVFKSRPQLFRQSSVGSAMKFVTRTVE